MELNLLSLKGMLRQIFNELFLLNLTVLTGKKNIFITSSTIVTKYSSLWLCYGIFIFLQCVRQCRLCIKQK